MAHSPTAKSHKGFALNTRALLQDDITYSSLIHALCTCSLSYNMSQVCLVEIEMGSHMVS